MIILSNQQLYDAIEKTSAHLGEKTSKQKLKN